MPVKNFLAIIYVTVLTISALHMPQPLLPLLSSYFNVQMDTVSLLMSATFIPLTVIPMLSGILLNFLSPKRIILFCALTHSIVVFCIPLTEKIYFAIMLRFLEGFLISAILTSNTTYISSKARKEKIQFFMSYYIAFTTIGGLLGRLFGSIIANYFGWKTTFYTMSVSLLLVLPVVYYFLEDVKPERKKYTDIISFKNFKAIVFDRTNILIYIAVFLLFFVFTGITNFIPFRIKSIAPQSSQMLIGFIYSGYITGIFMSFIATKVIKWFGSERKTMLAGFIFYGFFLLLMVIPDLVLIFFAMFGFCSGMFLVHSVASGYLNKLATEQKSLVNGAYIAFYYSGGVLGSYIPGIVYKFFGWESFIALLVLLVVSGFLSVTKLSVRV